MKKRKDAGSGTLPIFAPEETEAPPASARRPHAQPRAPGEAIEAASTLAELKGAAAACQACPLWERGTQTVFGEGRLGVPLMLVGEQPGDSEDRQGRPFVGPSGKLLDQALSEVGLDRANAYVTNAVKHFKWEPRGRLRIHVKPGAREIAACRPWLTAEIAQIKPMALVCLGATAAHSLLGKGIRISESRGKIFTTFSASLAPIVMITVHPSSLLRIPDEAARQSAMKHFVADLAMVVEALRREGLRPL